MESIWRAGPLLLFCCPCGSLHLTDLVDFLLCDCATIAFAALPSPPPFEGWDFFRPGTSAFISENRA